MGLSRNRKKNTGVMKKKIRWIFWLAAMDALSLNFGPSKFFPTYKNQNKKSINISNINKDTFTAYDDNESLQTNWRILNLS